MKVTQVRCFEVSGPATVEASEERQLQMLDVYPELARRGPGGGADRVTGTYVEVAADEGATGLFGPIFPETVPIILAKLAGHVVGQDPLAFERIWDVLYRQDRHARKGYEMMAISAVDCALWDLRGKLLGLPVYSLLGGPTRPPVDCYASMLGHSLDLGLVRAGPGGRRAGFQGPEVVLPPRPERRPARYGAQCGDGARGARGGRAKHRDHAGRLHGLGRDLHDPHVGADRRIPPALDGGTRAAGSHQ